MSKPWLLVTPASRGIGFALAKNLVSRTSHPLVVTGRSDLDRLRSRLVEGVNDPSLTSSERLRVMQLDVTDENSISSAAEECRSLFPSSSWHMHLAFVVPGILRVEKSPEKVDATGALDSFRINALGPLLVAKHFVQFLPRRATKMPKPEQEPGSPLSPNATLALMSARVGSISDNRLGGWFSYRASKAAVTQLARTLDHHLQVRAGGKACCVALHPGTVRTEFSEGLRNEREGQKGVFWPDEAAERLVQVVSQIDASKEGGGRGRFWDWEGKEIPP